MSRLVFEVGTEAIPAGYVPPALAAFEERARNDLAERRLEAASVRALGTAKRLILEVDGLAPRQEDRVREVQGPRVEAAFKDGKPTPAALGFARKNGVSVDDLERVSSDRGEFLLARVHEAGLDARELLAELLPQWVEALPWPKTMVWTAARFRFPRPIRWIVCLLDDAVLPVRVAGIDAGSLTRGHRLHGKDPVSVPGAGDLEPVLVQAGVVADAGQRRSAIEEQLGQEAKRLGGGVVHDAGLLDEVAYLTEAPRVYSGKFDREFLDLPREVVIAAMRSHQRYFCVEDKKGTLLPHFLVVTDGSWEDPSQVITGNERVLRARLSDARFYWDVDLKKGLSGMFEAERSIVWLESVGTLAEKSERVAGLVDRLGKAWHGNGWNQLREDVVRAARYSKADLASEMIKDGKEFTGLQGLIGARYAEAGGESATLVRALSEQYLPRGARDPLPESVGGTLLAFADRLDTIAGCLSAGFVPTGSQDPYALRRAANGMIRILMEKKLHVSLEDVTEAAVSGLPEGVRQDPGKLRGDILDFLRDRIAFFLGEHRIRYDVADAVLTADADDPLDALSRARALEAMREDESLGRLVVGFKRAANILKGVDVSGLPAPDSVDWNKTEPAEKELHAQVTRVNAELASAREKKDYPAMLEKLLSLRKPIDTFFDDVMVMSEDPGERDRRLALLHQARGLFHHFFEPSRIVIEGE